MPQFESQSATDQQLTADQMTEGFLEDNHFVFAVHQHTQFHRQLKVAPKLIVVVS